MSQVEASSSVASQISSNNGYSVGQATEMSTSSVPESFGTPIGAKNSFAQTETQSPAQRDIKKTVPESFGTDISTKNAIAKEKIQGKRQSKSIDKNSHIKEITLPTNKEKSLQNLPNAQTTENAQELGFAGTLLTEDGHMEYNEVTGDLHRIGENIEDYTFDFDENTPLNMPLLEAFKSFALENKMSVASAKKIAHFYDAQMQKGNAEALAQAHQEQVKMREICANDPEIGGAKFHESLRLAKAGIRRFDSEGSLSKILNETGFGSHPEVVRFMHRVGKAFAETSMVTGAKPKRELSTAELFYPSMRK